MDGAGSIDPLGDEQWDVDTPSGLRARLDRFREAVEPVARDLADKTSESARRAQDAARDRLDSGVASITMEQWRTETEAALSDITAVLLTMDARLAALEQRDD